MGQISQTVDFSQYNNVKVREVTIPGILDTELSVVATVMEKTKQWQAVIPLRCREKSLMYRLDGGYYIVRLYHFHRIVSGADGQEKVWDWEAPIFYQTANPITGLTGAIIPRLFVGANGQMYISVIKDADRLPRIGHPEGMALEAPRASATNAPAFVVQTGKYGHSDQARQEDHTALGVILVDEMSSQFDWVPIEQMTDSADIGGMGALFATMDKAALARYAQELWPR